MPSCGSQIILCDLPIRFDTYRGCTFGCKYCFACRKYDMSEVKPFETKKSLINFIKGERTIETAWCDWNIPLHWGGLSDPFQPAELKYQKTKECLKVFSEYYYPFVISTKGIIAKKTEYYELLKQCNFVFQASMLCPEYDKLEPGAPKYDDRLAMLEKIAKIAKRVVVRIQPYMVDYHPSILKAVKNYNDIGVYGIIVEGIKLFNYSEGMIKRGADYVYPKAVLKGLFLELRQVAHNNNLVFLVGENRLRYLSDSLVCCGTEGLEGFIGNKANLNHYILNTADFAFTGRMKQPHTGGCFKAIVQKAGLTKYITNSSFAELMTLCTRDKGKIDIFLGE